MANDSAEVITTHTGSADSIKFVSSLQKKGLNIEGSEVDVTKESSVDSFVRKVLTKQKRIDILCNLVGGINQKKSIDDVTLDEWNRMMVLNLQSCFLMMRSCIGGMKNNGFGRIISIASMTAVTPEAKRGGYGVAKAGVIALTKTVAEEVKEFGTITVNAIAPSVILTEKNKRWGTKEDLKKWVTPDQIADMIIHLCSDSGSAINGQVIQMYGKV